MTPSTVCDVCDDEMTIWLPILTFLAGGGIVGLVLWLVCIRNSTPQGTTQAMTTSQPGTVSGDKLSQELVSVRQQPDHEPIYEGETTANTYESPTKYVNMDSLTPNEYAVLSS